METTFKLSPEDSCSISIIGLESDLGVYTNEDYQGFITDKFKYSESVSINFSKYFPYNSEGGVVDYEVVNHTEEDVSTFKLTKDGHYKFGHIVIANTNYLKNIIAIPDLSELPITNESIFVYMDSIVEGFEEDLVGKIVEFDKNGIIICVYSVEEFILYCNETEEGLYYFSEQDLFTICQLSNCFYTYCRQILKDPCGKAPKDFTFIRDIIWMAINTITYLVELKQFIEAQRILEKITKCGGVCNTLKTCNCGCS